jgi:hypothetical protein
VDAAITQWLQENSKDASLQMWGCIDQKSLPPLRLKPLTQLKNNPLGISYSCAIAQQFTSICDQPVSLIAQELAEILQHSRPRLEPFQWLAAGTEFHVSSSGWITICLCDQAMAAWLQVCMDTLLTTIQPPLGTQRPVSSPETNTYDYLMTSITTKLTEQHFQLLYTHARCCSLLRQAATTALIELAHVSDHESEVIKIIQPTPIPWLTTSQTLQFQHLAEQQLLWQIVSTFDDLECVALSRDAVWKKAVNLAEHFQQFHRFCPIWGAVRSTQPSLAQARLGLVNLTQRGLRQIMHNKLDLLAPSEL